VNLTLVNTSGRMSSDGSRLISSLLKRAGHKVSTIFLARPDPVRYSPNELESLHEILSKTDLLLIAVYSSYALRARQLTTFVKNRYPGLMVIWGGPHCISAPELSLRHADGVCFSEGDEVIVELVNKIESGQEYLDCSNMAFNVNGSMVINGVRPPFSDLDSLPYADYDLDDHFLLDSDLFQMTKQKMKEHLAGYPYYIPTLYLTTSRGCPHNCAYCNNCRYVAMFGRNSMRFQSTDRVVSELKHTIENLDFVNFIGLGDDDFLMRSNSDIEKFAENYRKIIGLPFGIAISANSFRKNKLAPLLNAGLKAVQIGVQSGSQRVLTKVYNRKLSTERCKSTLHEIANYQRPQKLDVLVDFIIDNPYETRDDIIATYKYILDLPPNMRINLFFLSFFPGTPLYDRALTDGIIQPFTEDGFRFYTRSNVQYQKNYETFLILMLRRLRNSSKMRNHVPKFLMRFLGNRAMRKIGGLLSEGIYARLVKPFIFNASRNYKQNGSSQEFVGSK